MGDAIISQTLNPPLILEPSNCYNYCDFLSCLTFHNEHVFNNSYSDILGEHTMDVDQFILGEETNPQLKSYIPATLRDAFYLLNSSTYYSLYPDI